MGKSNTESIISIAFKLVAAYMMASVLWQVPHISGWLYLGLMSDLPESKNLMLYGVVAVYVGVWIGFGFLFMRCSHEIARRIMSGYTSINNIERHSATIILHVVCVGIGIATLFEPLSALAELSLWTFGLQPGMHKSVLGVVSGILVEALLGVLLITCPGILDRWIQNRQGNELVRANTS